MIDRSLSDPDLTGTIRVVSAAATHVGHVRATNEDSILNAPPIYLVADGMGGHNAGEVASAIAVEEFEKLTIQENVTVEQLGEALRSAAIRIGELGGEATLGAGTTVAVVATMVLDGVGYWVVLNLGDSRVYRLSGDIFEQVSVDHSVVQELMDRGELTPEQAKIHPYRHMVTRALGAGPDSDPDYWLIPAEAGDRMLICSDGLTGEVDDAAIEKLLRSPSDVRTLSQDLVGRALDGGGHDNISVVLVEAVEVVGQSRIAEDTASRDGAEPQDDGFEIDEDTLPRGLRDGGDERR
ncbi:PP2C family protein-serine/threonine phosphatase [Brachybacterium massiliense]|uniref:Protein phosphatase 2C domain-containing protein n=1 Tax=Brachybacterium massiliense TaxID=1755098 RepID=A0A921SYB0_9MICO|nr:protein phosphatase 2C domain-containing protein [Brachybacterium massiliense]HJG92077.1 protein phosphatase 2C domain-containing protein [Brachybacterium massiliense]